ncbi:methyltransferase domain-containing protein [Myroides sp. LJL119]
MNCPLCNFKLELRATSTFYLCKQCHSYVKDKQYYFSSLQEHQHYKKHNNDINDLGYKNFSSDLTKAIVDLCPSNNLGLDFGCGSAPIITHQLKSLGYTVNIFDIYFFPQTCYKNYKYDFIFSCEVFEHLHQPNLELTNLLNLLKTDGYLFIKTHLYDNQTPFDNWYYIKDQTHVFIYTKKTMRYIAEKFNLQVIYLGERVIIFKK